MGSVKRELDFGYTLQDLEDLLLDDEWNPDPIAEEDMCMDLLEMDPIEMDPLEMDPEKTMDLLGMNLKELMELMDPLETDINEVDPRETNMIKSFDETALDQIALQATDMHDNPVLGRIRPGPPHKVVGGQ